MQSSFRVHGEVTPQPDGRSGSSFEIYLRTGRRVRAVELKFNPWHDLYNGRFTFAGTGRNFGRGGRQSASNPTSDYERFDPRNPRNHTIYTVKQGDTLSGIAKFRKGLTAPELAWLNDLPDANKLRVGQRLMVPKQTYLDAGRRARANLVNLYFYMDTHGGRLPPNVAKVPSIEEQLNSNWQRVLKNGYTFHLDVLMRPRRFDGEVIFAPKPRRSKKLQTQAGGADRRSTDDGGHYVAARFNGPLEAFNHFAQDASFNRGAYRVLEDFWAKEHKQDIVSLSKVRWNTKEHRPGRTALRSGGSLMEESSNKSSRTRKKASDMAEEKFEKLGPMMGAIGGRAAADVGGDPDGIYLYVEVGNRWIRVSLFRDEGKVVRYYDPSTELTNLIWNAWEEESEDPGSRWCVMEYEIRGNKFDGQFKYPDEVDVESFDEDRREAALVKRYGDKPVIYPPIPDHFHELTSE